MSTKEKTIILKARLLFLLMLILFPLSSSLIAHDEAEYFIDTKILTIPSVKIGGVYVYNAQLLLDAEGKFVIMGYSETPPVSGEVTEQCTNDLISLKNLTKLQKG